MITKKAAVLLLGFMGILMLGASVAPGVAVAGYSGDPISPSREIRGVPAFELSVPQDESERNYLGLSGKGTFSIDRIRPQILIIEFFSYYCPHCQRLAPKVNEIYQQIQARPELKSNVKMIGIGRTNSRYEVDQYKKKYRIPFPVFPDKDIAIAEKLDIWGTPLFVCIRINDKGSQEQFYTYPGSFEDTSEFLNRILTYSGLTFSREEKP